jgi:hypothetical protein
VDREDVVAVLQQRLVAAEEVADRGLRRRRQLLAAAHPLPERGQVGHVALAAQRLAELDVERDLVQAELRDELARQVVGAVGDDGYRHRRRQASETG